MLTCSIGIMAYNEEANIGRLLQALVHQRLAVCFIREIYVVASGCTDRTEEIVRDFMSKDGRIGLLSQRRREGKAAAINLYLSRAEADILVLESGDTIPELDAIEKLVGPFADPAVGMTGARPVPVNDADHFVGFGVNLLWNLHHRISLEHPKLGELVAFRSLVRQIPRDTAVDEASIEAIVARSGLKLKYVGDALVYNKGPDNCREFLAQRRRIAAGHLYLRRTQGYRVSTTSTGYILRSLIREMKWGPREVLWTAGAIGLEVMSRALGRYDYAVRKRNPYVWAVVESTKQVKGQVK